MELAMSMFATQADYWRARSELAEATVQETARELGCEPDNELMLEAAHGLKTDAERYRWLRDRLMACDWDYMATGDTALIFTVPPELTVSADCDATVDSAMRVAA